MVTAVLPGAWIGEEIGRHAGEADGIIEFAMKQQTTIGTEGRAAEHELHRPGEFEPQRAVSASSVAFAANCSLRRF